MVLVLTFSEARSHLPILSRRGIFLRGERENLSEKFCFRIYIYINLLAPLRKLLLKNMLSFEEYCLDVIMEKYRLFFNDNGHKENVEDLSYRKRLQSSVASIPLQNM
jgi:hypothetical protein